MMPDREKVKRALQACYSADIEWCQAREKGLCDYKVSYCRMALFKDAAELLEAQEPRVMTLHEIDDVINIASEEYKRIFWAEVRSKTRKSFGVFQLDIASEDYYEALLLGCSWPACYKRSTYGIRWRCWTSRPTDEQREATPWE